VKIRTPSQMNYLETTEYDCPKKIREENGFFMEKS
jgi:hypothetical protein